MWPTLLEVQSAAGPVGLHSYGLLVLLAFCAAFLLVHLRAQQIGLHPDRLIGLYVGAAIGGLAGGRLLYAFAVEPARTLAEPLSLLSLSGFAFYGGVLGGALAVGTLAVAQRLPAWKLADIAAPAVILGLGIGRLGCFFAGCCHGAEAPIGDGAVALLDEGLLHGQIWLSSTFPFVTTEFHDGVGRLRGIPLYPTQLWSAATGIGLGAALSLAWTRRRFDGQIAAVALLLEPAARVTIEAFRADHRGYAVPLPSGLAEVLGRALPGMAHAGEEFGAAQVGLTTSQTIGLTMMVAGAVIYALRRRAGVAPEQAIEDLELADDTL